MVHDRTKKKSSWQTDRDEMMKDTFMDDEEEEREENEEKIEEESEEY